MFLRQILPGLNLSTWQEFPTGHLEAPSLSGDFVEILGHKKPREKKMRPFWSPPSEPFAQVPGSFSRWLCSFCAPRLSYPSSKAKLMGTRPPRGPVGAAFFPVQPSQGTECRVGGTDVLLSLNPQKCVLPQSRQACPCPLIFL